MCKDTRPGNQGGHLTYRNIVECDASLGDLLELGLVLSEVHRAAAHAAL